MSNLYQFKICSILTTIIHLIVASESEELLNQQYFKIEGKVIVPFTSTGDKDWLTNTKVLVDGGQHLGFLRGDGTFTINNVPSGSYLVEVTHPVYLFEPTRVDITSKGKIRARKLNNVQTNKVVKVKYPLKFKAKGKANYFQQREQWSITDLLKVLMMLLPVVAVFILPKLINTNDPETQKEMQNQMKMLNPIQNMPEMSEILTSWLGGGSSGSKNKAVKPKPPRRR